MSARTGGAWALLERYIVEAKDLSVIYSVHGKSNLPERELELRGYEDSRLVRVGNAAADQFQLDIYGSLISAALLYCESQTVQRVIAPFEGTI